MNRDQQESESGDPKSSEEARKRQEEEQRRKQEQEGRTGESKEEIEARKANDQNLPPWMARLPAEIRDYFSGGRHEKVPARYRYLIDRYTRWLNKKRLQAK